ASAEKHFFGGVARREDCFSNDLALGEFRCEMHRNGAECSGCVSDIDAFTILQPASGRGEAKADSIGYAIVVQIPILDQNRSQYLKEMGIAGAVGRTIKLAAR